MKMQRWGSAVTLFGVLSLMAMPSEAATETFQQGVSGYGGCVDTSIRTGGYDYENTNYGNSADLVVESNRWAAT